MKEQAGAASDGLDQDAGQLLVDSPEVAADFGSLGDLLTDGAQE